MGSSLVSRTGDDPPVCTFKTFPCMPATRAQAFQHVRCRVSTCARVAGIHGDVFECTHGGVFNLYTEFHTTPQHTTPHPDTPTPHDTTRHHHHTTTHTTSQTPHALPHTTEHNNTHNNTRRQIQRERDREKKQRMKTGRERGEDEREDKTRQDKMKEKMKEKTTDVMMWGRAGSGSEQEKAT